MLSGFNRFLNFSVKTLITKHESLHQIQVCFGAKGKHFFIAVYNNSVTEAGKKSNLEKVNLNKQFLYIPRRLSFR